ncbi:MAG: hypothetical protein IKN65_06200 [Clostridia bacterium]|nr:hypothetical protein [Clostridia bacterium]
MKIEKTLTIKLPSEEISVLEKASETIADIGFQIFEKENIAFSVNELFDAFYNEDESKIAFRCEED